MNKVVIAGYHGYENAGDDATLITIIQNIRSINDKTNILVLSKNPKLTIAENKVSAAGRFNIFAILFHIMTAKAVVLGGGSLLQDVTSSRSNMYYLGIIRIAKFFRKKVMLYSNGIGPLSKEKSRQAVAKVLDRIDMITLRESYAKEFLNELGVNKPEIYITADPAFMLRNLLDEDIRKKKLIESKVPLDKKNIGVCIRDWNGRENYIRELAKFCDYIKTKYDYNILFIPFQYPKDKFISDEIRNAMKNEAYIIEDKCSVSEIINILSSCHINICMRLHSIIFSSLSGVPVLGLVYDPKVEYYLKILKQEKLGTTLDLSYDKCIEKFEALESNYNEVSEELINTSLHLTKEAKENEKLLKKVLEF